MSTRKPILLPTLVAGLAFLFLTMAGLVYEFIDYYYLNVRIDNAFHRSAGIIFILSPIIYLCTCIGIYLSVRTLSTFKFLSYPHAFVLALVPQAIFAALFTQSILRVNVPVKEALWQGAVTFMFLAFSAALAVISWWYMSKRHNKKRNEVDGTVVPPIR